MNILLATDGSACSQLSETLLAKLPRAAGATVHVATAVPAPAVMMASLQPIGAYSMIEQADLLWKAHHDRGTTVVREAGERMRAAGFETKEVVLDGDIGSVLLDYAHEHAIDLIAVGSRGEGAFKAFFLGSVARRLVAYSECSVLVARGEEKTTPEEHIARLAAKERLTIVVAVDGSNGAAASLQSVMDAGPDRFAKGIAVCAAPLSLVPAGLDPILFGETYGYDVESGNTIAAEAAEKLRASCSETSAVMELDRPSNLLFEVARKEDADLIVIGATRHGAVERFLLGSVSFDVASGAPCSVLVVRPPKTPQ
ncbi:MAG: universal stress protein [Fimbriimonadaceae bacterium]|nr:universal stress protein [Fimbriimonadaceae bacterium]